MPPHNVQPIGVPPPTSESGMPGMPMMRQPFNMAHAMSMQQPPQPPAQQRPPLPHQLHPDDMDVEMEDAMSMPPSHNSNKDNNMMNNNKPQSLSDQLLAVMKSNENDKDFRDRERDRDRDRDRRDRDRGGLGDRDRDDRSRDRGRDRDRDRAGRDRGRRTSRDNNRDRDDRRGGERDRNR